MFRPSHLTDEAASILAGATDERVYFIQSKRWVAYPKAVQILEHLNKMLKHPRTTRMPSLIVYGDSGMGKSMLVDKFKAECAAGSAADSAPNPNKVLGVELSGRPTDVADPIDARGQGILAVGRDPLFHLRRAEPCILPDDGDDRDVDLRKASVLSFADQNLTSVRAPNMRGPFRRAVCKHAACQRERAVRPSDGGLAGQKALSRRRMIRDRL
jgi:hypothetical protein